MCGQPGDADLPGSSGDEAKYGDLVRRRPSVPREVLAALALARRERVLAAALDTSGRWVVATDQALHLPMHASGTLRPEAGPAGVAVDEPTPSEGVRSTERLAYRRIPWEQVERAEWDRDADLLRVVETAPLGQRMPTWSLRFERADDRFLRLVRERITASVVVDRRVPIQGRHGVRVIARRGPSIDAELVWAVAFDEELDPSDPEILAAAEEALAAVRAEVEP